MTRLRFLAALNPPTPEFDAIDDDAELAFVPLEDVWPPPRWAPTQRRLKSEVASGYTRFREGDILVPKITPTFEARRSVTARGLSTRVAAGTTELHIVRPKRADTRYLNYCFQTKPFISGGEAAMIGVAGQKRVPETWLLDYEVPVEDLSSQRGIADFLDGETAQIRAIVEKKRALIRLLEVRLELARLNAVSGAAVHARRPTSGALWLDAVPEHWRVEKLKYVARMESGHTPNKQVPEYWENCTIPWVTLNDVGHLEDGDEFVSPKNSINELGLANSSARVLPVRTVILSRDATVGRAALLGAPMAISQHFVGWVCGEALLPEYLLEVLRGPLQSLFRSLSFGSTIPTIGMPELRDLVVPIPPLQEQRQIADELRQLRAAIVRTTRLITAQIGCFAERRETLITTTVTGQLDVAEVAA